jgi:hypothetical protein
MRQYAGPVFADIGMAPWMDSRNDPSHRRIEKTVRRAWIAGVWVLCFAAPCLAAADEPQSPRPHTPEVLLGVHAWRIIARESGPVNYYTVVDDPGGAFIRARYRSPEATAVLGIEVPPATRRIARYLRWRWRTEALPPNGSECGRGNPDSAASVYVTWKRGLRWYTLKYVWSTVDPVGSVCHRIRNPFVAQDTVVAESGPPLDVWTTETIDLAGDFRRYFEGGDPRAEIPDLVGVGVMSDGDQSLGNADADFGDFALIENEHPR